MRKKYILVLGGAGYIGSHMAYMLVDAGYSVIVFDNLSTGHKKLVPKKAIFIRGDLCDKSSVEAVFKKYPVDTVMHFAAAIVVSESIVDPLKYYNNNLCAFVNLLSAMRKAGVDKIIFSSTAAVYGLPKKLPLNEDSQVLPINPYGRSKLMVEKILADCACAYPLSYVIFRYFNACGAHENDLTGESHDPETHLIPNILRVINGKEKELKIFGGNCKTQDGTCVRDYVHVDDLCRAHLLALKALNKGMNNYVFNLGSGSGYSVKQIIAMAEKVTAKKVRAKIVSPRSGDSASLIASSVKAKKILGWKSQKNLEDIIRSAWVWEQKKGKEGSA